MSLVSVPSQLLSAAQLETPKTLGSFRLLSEEKGLSHIDKTCDAGEFKIYDWYKLDCSHEFYPKAWIVYGRVILAARIREEHVQLLYISTGRAGHGTKRNLIPMSALVEINAGDLWIGKHYWSIKDERWIAHNKKNFPKKIEKLIEDITKENSDEAK